MGNIYIYIYQKNVAFKINRQYLSRFMVNGHCWMMEVNRHSQTSVSDDRIFLEETDLHTQHENPLDMRPQRFCRFAVTQDTEIYCPTAPLMTQSSVAFSESWMLGFAVFKFWSCHSDSATHCPCNWFFPALRPSRCHVSQIHSSTQNLGPFWIRAVW